MPEEKKQKYIDIDGQKIPYVAIGNEELDKKTQLRTEELWDMMKDEHELNKEDGGYRNEAGMRFLSLLISRGKSEDGKAINCECGKTYLVYPNELKKCECGKELQYK